MKKYITFIVTSFATIMFVITVMTFTSHAVSNLSIDVINDFIEVSNLTNNTISAKGLYLTDDESDLFQWQMPSFIIRGNSTTRIRGVENSSTTTIKRAQTNFNVSTAEKLLLADAAGNILAEWNFTPLPSYTIFFDVNGGEMIGANPLRYTNTHGRISGEFPMVTRNGFDLVGWFTQPNGGTEITADTVFNGNATAYAQWALRDGEYIITYNANGGTLPVGTPASTATTLGRLFTLPVPTRLGQQFDGWFTQQTGGERVRTGGTGTVFNANTTIWARWILNSQTQIHDITLNENYSGGSVSQTVTTRFCGRLTSLPILSRDGFRFEGWFTQATGGTEVVVGLDTGTYFNAPATIYARWSSFAGYTIMFDSNGGVEIDPNTRTTEGNGRLTELPVPTRGGFRFDGWFTQSTGGTRITVNTVFNANNTIYARWTAIRVTFNRNGGAVITPSFMDVNENNKLVTLPDITREEFTFVGWFTKAVGGDEVTTNTVFVQSSNVYARWITAIPNTFTITLDVNAGDSTTAFISTTNVATGTEGKLEILPSPSRNDYTPDFKMYEFEGWYTTPDIGGERVTRNHTVFTEDITIYARWILVDPPMPG